MASWGVCYGLLLKDYEEIIQKMIDEIEYEVKWEAIPISSSDTITHGIYYIKYKDVSDNPMAERILRNNKEISFTIKKLQK